MVVAMAGLNKVTIHADAGEISMFFFNMGQACDYRIVGEGTIYENAFSQLGTIPKGGGGYFLSRLLGAGRAADVLQWPRFSAEEALNIGVVDKIVPVAKLEETALKTAELYREPQIATLLAVRKLLKSNLGRTAPLPRDRGSPHPQPGQFAGLPGSPEGPAWPWIRPKSRPRPNFTGRPQVCPTGPDAG